MVILFTKNGHPELSQLQYLESSMTGIEKNLELVKMILDASMSLSLQRMESAEFLTTLDTKSTSKVLMVIDEIETLPGLVWLCKTHTHTFMIASGGILMKNLNGHIKDQFLSLNRAFVFTKHMLEWLKNGVK